MSDRYRNQNSGISGPNASGISGPNASGISGPGNISTQNISRSGYATVRPATIMAQVSKGPPKIMFSAAGGLAVGLLVGFLVISGGSEEKVAEAGEPAVVAVIETETSAEKPPTTEKPITEDPRKTVTEVPAQPAVVEPGVVEVEPKPAQPAVVEPGVVEVEPKPAQPVVAEPKPEPITAELAFTVSPKDAAKSVVIKVDGAVIDGRSFSLTFSGTKRVSIVATAPGYRPFRKKLSVSSDAKIPIVMRKRPAPGPRRPSGPSGLISL